MTETDREVLEAMIVEMNKSTARACAAIDDALTAIQASNERIDEMERAAKDDRARRGVT